MQIERGINLVGVSPTFGLDLDLDLDFRCGFNTLNVIGPPLLA